MATLLMKFVGPMQSWGTTSRFDQRDTGKEPSKSGILGLLAASLGIDRENWNDLEPLTRLSMAVRHDRPGVLKKDFQTAGCAISDRVIKADGTLEKKDGITSTRYYLADAAFLVGLEGDIQIINKIQEALQNPTWPLSLGRKSYISSEMIWFEDGVQEEALSSVLEKWPWISSLRKGEKTPPEKLLISYETSNHEKNSKDGVLKMDQPLSSFALRRFGARFVKSRWIPFPQEVFYVSP
jgi:CRISPR system Cascade subunit CasD